jgi:hypothetical protein
MDAGKPLGFYMDSTICELIISTPPSHQECGEPQVKECVGGLPFISGVLTRDQGSNKRTIRMQLIAKHAKA